MEKVYYKAIDYVKIIAAILVVCVHTGPLLSVNEEMNFFLVQILARCAVPFFFVASAFFFFKKIDRNIALSDEKNMQKLKKYIFHLGRMYLFWTLIYFSIQIVIWFVNGLTMHSFLLYLRDFFFRGSYYHLWFLPALMFSVIFIYILLEIWKEEKVLLLSLVLYGMGMLINVYGDAFLQIPIIGTLLKLYSTIFATARNGLFFGCIFVVIGYILATKKTRLNTVVLTISTVISFVFLVLEAYFIKYLGLMNSLTCMYISLIPLIFFLFQILLQFKSKEKANPILRNASTLLYLIHCYFTFILQYVPIIKDHSLLYFLFTMVLSIAFIVGYMRISEKYTFLRRVI